MRKEHTAAELEGSYIRIEGPVRAPRGYKVLVIADDEEIRNCTKIELVILPTEIISAKLTLAHIKQDTEEDFQTSDVDVRLSAYVQEVEEA